MRGEIIEFFIIKQIKKPRLRALPHTSFVLYRFLRALQQNTAQSRLLYLLNTIQYNTMQHNTTQHNITKQNKIQCNTIQYYTIK